MVSMALASCGHSVKPIPVKDLHFDGIFFNSVKDKHAGYCLEEAGFFRAPIAKNTDSLVQDWISRHPAAVAIPVAAISKDTTYTFTFCWVLDGLDTLNNDLVRTGCVPGKTMLGRADWVNNKDYIRFIEQIKINDSLAQRNKRGIWNRPDSLNAVD